MEDIKESWDNKPQKYLVDEDRLITEILHIRQIQVDYLSAISL